MAKSRGSGNSPKKSQEQATREAQKAARDERNAQAAKEGAAYADRISRHDRHNPR